MKKEIGTGVIGCGSFANNIHIPNLLKNPKYRIIGVSDVEPGAAETTRGIAGADYSATDPEKIFRDHRIDAVFITTRHDSHAELSIKAAESKKHILCEKPMGLDYDECRLVKKAVLESGVKYSVGYNRGLAPMAVKAKKLLEDRSGKILAFHRMQNALPPKSWLLSTKTGGGRITGEGCHIFDMLCEIIQAPPAKVYASGGSFLDGSEDPMDSACITITFADGSVGTALLMSSGSNFFPKEATEIYSGGRAIYINDFKEMEYCGFEGRRNIKLVFDSQDKGHAAEIDLFADSILNDSPPPNGLQNAARAAFIGFKARESINSGKPADISEDEYNS